MPGYLDPKADVVFKKIFGEHPKLLKSFLNAVLPLPQEGLIESLEYLPTEQVPVIPALKTTVVDVKCTDTRGRHFIVEMQMQWTVSFKQRMLFNTSRAYVNQLNTGEDYRSLKPVYGLGLIGSKFDTEPQDWYHHYKMVNIEKPTAEIKELQLIFIELPKFKAQNFQQKKLQILWLRFLSELNEQMTEIPAEWLTVPEIEEAVALAEKAAYTKTELTAYEKYWDAVSIEKTLMNDSLRKGLAEGIELGIELGEERGERKTQAAIARRSAQAGMDITQIAVLLALSVEEVKLLLE